MLEYKVGEIICADDPIEINAGKEAIELIVTHTGDRPIQVGSHYHFAEVNFALKFDREAAFGKHLDIPSSTAVRFDPGEETRVRLVDYSGEQNIYGFLGATMGCAKDENVKKQALENLKKMESEVE
ncbi:MAG: urease subunit beta [Bacillota bacterium]|nr:urease subunit beta [Bacillota bacterium]